MMAKGDPKEIAEKLIKEAQDKAEEIVVQARQKADDIVQDAKQRIKTLTPKTKDYVLVDEKNSTVAIHCNDPRFQEVFHHFIEDKLGLESYTPFIVPGASQLLAMYDSVPKFSSALLRYLEFMVKHRGIKNMIIIMHEDCAWYKHFVPQFHQIKGSQREQQVDDMLASRTLLQEEFPGIKIRLFYAAITPDKKVEFSEITDQKH